MVETRRLTRLAAEVTAAASLPEGRLLVALSGGADSAVCAWVARQRSAETRAVHVHHGLAGSGVLQAAAESIAERLGIPLVVARVDVPEGSSPEGRARAVRLQALRSAAEPGEWILTGHTRDDQAETVLDHLLRGSGLDGLSGIPERRSPWVRPLLSVTRATTRELATLLGLPWRDDPANEDLRYFRNRIRRRLIPLLEAEYAPGLRTALARTARLAAAEAGHLEEQVDRLGIMSTPGRARVARGSLLAAAPVVGARALRRIVEEARSGYPAGEAEVSRLWEVVRGERAATELAGGLRAVRKGPWLLVERPAEAPAPPAARLEPGVVRWGRFAFEVGPVAGSMPMPLSPWVLVVAEGPRLLVRAAAEVDAVTLVGGPKTVGRVLADAGVPAGDRPTWPVVTADEAPVWVPGVRRAAPGWEPEGADRYLCIVAAEESGWPT